MIKKRTPQKKKLQIEIKKLNQNDEQNLKNTRWRFREFRAESTVFDGYLDKKIEEVLSLSQLENNSTELAEIGLPWWEDIESEANLFKRILWKKNNNKNAIKRVRRFLTAVFHS